nr:MAG: VOC family protein [Hyphomicrobiales bacterium]
MALWAVASSRLDEQENELKWEAFMGRLLFAAILLASSLAAGAASAQPEPFNEAGVTMGHWHLMSKDIEANKKIFLAMGGTLISRAGNDAVMFPGVVINLALGDEMGEGGTQGTVVNHVGFIVDNVQRRVAEWRSAGVTVLPGGNGRLDQAYVGTPDGGRIEILEDPTEPMPIRHEHVHLRTLESEVLKAQDWYARVFGGTKNMRNDAPVVDLPGVQMRFADDIAVQAPTRGHILDHIGFDVRDHQAFVARLGSLGIALDEPPRRSNSGGWITYITDPWGTRIEIVERVAQAQ